MLPIHSFIAIILVFVGCSANVVFLEHLIKFSPGCGDLITFSQFLFITLYGFVAVSKFGTVKPVVPIRKYMLAVALFYGSSLAGNLALGCHISMPIQMIFKSGSVLSSMALGVILLKRSYSKMKYVSVCMITIGIAMCLLISTKPDEHKDMEQSRQDYVAWLFGVFLLIASLLMGASLGICQEKISLEFGKHPRELLFYSHALALPGFVFFGNNIITQADKFSQSEMFTVPYIQLQLPLVWLYLVLNVLTQFICIRSVYVLVTEMSALAVTVTLTVRKFVSLLISIYYFRNPFTMYHWIGTMLVFGGTLMFSGTIQGITDTLKSKKEEKKD